MGPHSHCVVRHTQTTCTLRVTRKLPLLCVKHCSHSAAIAYEIGNRFMLASRCLCLEFLVLVQLVTLLCVLVLALVSSAASFSVAMCNCTRAHADLLPAYTLRI